MKILGTTGNQAADRCIREAIQIVLASFPDIAAAYVGGSYANGYAVSTSDLDLQLIFERTLQRDELLHIDQLGESFKLEIEVDLAAASLEKLQAQGMIQMASHYMHVWGRPVHLEIPEREVSVESYVGMHAAYGRMQLTRRKRPYHFPLAYPADGDLKGYDWRELKWQGVLEKSIKEIVVLTGWMATALVTWKAGVLVPTKWHCPKLFLEYVGGDVARSFVQITELCRDELHYRIPRHPEDLNRLKALLPAVLGIENYFLENYQDFLIEELGNADSQRVLMGLKRLGEIHYPNGKALRAVQLFSGASRELNEARDLALQFQTAQT